MQKPLLSALLAVLLLAPLGAQRLPPPDGPMTTTASGLQYSVLRAGEGTTPPGPQDKVKVHYTGWLTDGTVFDDSFDRGEPTEFGVSQVVAGWTEGLQLMTVGARYKFKIPANLGYGARRSGKIPPNSTLIFDVWLLGITPAGGQNATPEEKVEELSEEAMALVEAESAVYAFRKRDRSQEKVIELPSGKVPCEIVRGGEGEPLSKTPNARFELFFRVFNGREQLLYSTPKPVTTSLDRQTLPFLKEMPLRMKEGALYRCYVPASLTWGEESVRGAEGGLAAGESSYWVLELKRILPALAAPSFAKPDPAKLTTAESGLAYEVIEKGPEDAPKPTLTSKVRAHYAAWTAEGKVVASTYDRGEPETFALAGLFRGWQEGLQLMNAGSIYRFQIPPALAFGDTPVGDVPPGSTIVLHVELLEVQ